MSEDITLGNRINLKGFADALHRGDLVIVKKMVGQYLANYEKYGTIDKLELSLKVIHDVDKPNEVKKFEIKGKVSSNLGVYNGEDLDENIFAALDKTLKKIEKQLLKQKEITKDNKV